MSRVDMEEYMVYAYTSKTTMTTTGQTNTGITGLPLEIQDAIIGNLAVSTLRDLQRVSQHFHHRASRRLWRKLHFKLAASSFAYQTTRSSQFRLIEALRTITTSKHNYAQYVHELEVKVIENDLTVSHNELQLAARFLPDTDAQKLLSLSLFMLLRNATGLEKFKWKVPIEIDATCWKELAARNSLRRLVVQVNGRNSQFAGTNGVTAPGKVSYQHIADCGALTWLSISEIDDVNHLDDIAACIRSSAGSLKLLKLTFSTSLAAKAKKSAGPMPPGPPPIDIQFDDVDDTSSVDDEIQITPSSNATSSVDPDVIKKNKNLQENALARMLSVETDATTQSVEQILLNNAMMPPQKPAKALGDDAKKSLHELVDKLLDGKHVGADSAQLIDALKDKLDNASVSRSAKRQKPSTSNKIKGKPTKSTPSQPYSAAYVLPKSSNTSTLSNPWGAPPPFPQGTSPVAMFGSSAVSPNPQTYPSILPSGLPPPGSSTNPAHPSNYFLTTGSNTTDPLLADDLQNQGDLLAEDLLFNVGGGSSGKDYLSLLALTSHDPPVSSWSNSATQDPLSWSLFGGSPMKFLEKMKAIEKAGKKSSTPMTDALLKTSHTSLKKLLTQGQAPPPPAAFTAKSKLKGGKKTSPFAPAYDDDDLSESSESSSEDPASASSSTPQENVISDESKPASYDDMGVDIVHPDGSDNESGDEQEIVDDGDDTPRSLKDKGKAKETTAELIARPAARSTSPVKRQRETSDEENKNTSPEETMREWIRKKHGIAIEDLQLYLVPLKASVLGRAIQLHSLKHIVLLSVGGQGPFWQLMSKAQEERPLKLTDIHTDDVSTSFLQCVSKLKGVKSLVLRRRSKKASDNTTSKDPASIEEIRKLAVQPHISTLKVLAIENNQDQSWCLTQGFIWLLCARGESLQELSFHCGTHRFWEFTSLTEVPYGVTAPPIRTTKLRLPNLIALHYLGVGPSTRPPGAHSTGTGPGPNGEPLDTNHDLWSRDNYKTCHESLQTWAKRRKFAGDTKLKYVGIVNNYIEIGSPKIVKAVPKWLMDDYLSALAEGTIQDPAGTATNTDKADSPFHKWVQEKGYDKWIKGRKSDIKVKRLHECRATIFGKAVRNAKL